MEKETPRMSEHVCPWWLGYLLASPVRRLWHKPEEILAPYVKSGMTVLEIGPGMGFFTLPMARMVGENGLIICPDVQEKMLRSLVRRAKRAGVEKRVVTTQVVPGSLSIAEFAAHVDFTLAFAVVHEVPDQENLFREIHQSMKPGALLLISEPKGHVSSDSFNIMLTLTKQLGFEWVSASAIKRSLSVVLKKV
jgi:predicted methyltransferase